MSAPGEDQAAQDSLLREAAEWFARLRGPDAEASREAFEEWLSRDALHRRAYNRAAEIFAMGKLLDERGPPPLFMRLRRRSRGLAAVLGVLLLAVAAGLLVIRWPPRGPVAAIAGDGSKKPAVTELAAMGSESRQLTLADGSLVTLSPATALYLRFSASVRGVTLERGDARFRVAHERRPFIVYAGGGSITAHGTLFEVSLKEGRRVSVRLIEGSVDVALPPAAGARRRPIERLKPGQAISFAAAAKPSSGSGLESQAGGATGPSNRVQARDFDGIQLAKLLAEANQDAAPPIRLADRALGERRVSGRLRIDDSRLLAARVAALFNLVAQRDGSGDIVLHSK
jgi:transmembrane sensor